jgi:uncharacterized membrane protein YgdD (TMEM256/DUF423 family)
MKNKQLIVAVLLVGVGAFAAHRYLKNLANKDGHAKGLGVFKVQPDARYQL